MRPPSCKCDITPSKSNLNPNCNKGITRNKSSYSTVMGIITVLGTGLFSIKLLCRLYQSWMSWRQWRIRTWSLWTRPPLRVFGNHRYRCGNDRWGSGRRCFCFLGLPGKVNKRLLVMYPLLGDIVSLIVSQKISCVCFLSVPYVVAIYEAQCPVTSKKEKSMLRTLFDEWNHTVLFRPRHYITNLGGAKDRYFKTQSWTVKFQLFHCKTMPNPVILSCMLL